MLVNWMWVGGHGGDHKKESKFQLLLGLQGLDKPSRRRCEISVVRFSELSHMVQLCAINHVFQGWAGQRFYNERGCDGVANLGRAPKELHMELSM